MNSLVSNWEKFVPVLKDCLTKLCANAKAGRISNYFSAWTSITSDKEILSDIKGMTIELSEMPHQHYSAQTTFTDAESEIIQHEI